MSVLPTLVAEPVPATNGDAKEAKDSFDHDKVEIVLFDHDNTLTRVHTNKGFNGNGNGFGFSGLDYIEPGAKKAFAAYKKWFEDAFSERVTEEEFRDYAIGEEGVRKNYLKNGKHPVIIKHIINRLLKMGKFVGIVSFNEGVESASQLDKHSGKAGEVFIRKGLSLSIKGVNWEEIPIVSHERGDMYNHGKNRHIEEILFQIVKKSLSLNGIDFTLPKNKKKVMLVEDDDNNIEYAKKGGYATAAEVANNDAHYYKDNAYLQDLMLVARFDAASLSALVEELVEVSDARAADLKRVKEGDARKAEVEAAAKAAEAELAFCKRLIDAVTPKLPATKKAAAAAAAASPAVADAAPAAGPAVAAAATTAAPAAAATTAANAAPAVTFAAPAANGTGAPSLAALAGQQPAANAAQPAVANTAQAPVVAPQAEAAVAAASHDAAKAVTTKASV